MTDRDRLLHIALLAVPGVDPAACARLRRRWGSLAAAIDAGRDAIAGELGLLPPMADPIARLPERLPEARDLLRELEDRDVAVAAPGEPEYPPRLARFPGAPWILFARGDTRAFHSPAVSIVGSRRATEHGRWLAFEIAREAAVRGFAVVSGLAHGIDSAAHRGALEAGGPTIAVLPHGILRLDDRLSARSLFGPALEAGFTALSQFYPAAPFPSDAALRRNWTIAALGDAVLVVEARRGGGSHRTARDAKTLGLPLFVVRWGKKAEQNEGNRILFHRGAAPLGADLPPGEIVDRIAAALPPA